MPWGSRVSQRGRASSAYQAGSSRPTRARRRRNASGSTPRSSSEAPSGNTTSGGAMRRDLEAFELVILRRPAQAPEYDEETLDRLQLEHLAYRDQLREQ